MIGFKDDNGSWKIIPILWPLIRWNSSSETLVKSSPSYMMEPSTIRPFAAKIPMMVLLVTDLPEPDSPTIHNVSPLYKSNETPLTAWT